MERNLNAMGRADYDVLIIGGGLVQDAQMGNSALERNYDFSD